MLTRVTPGGGGTRSARTASLEPGGARRRDGEGASAKTANQAWAEPDPGLLPPPPDLTVLSDRKLAFGHFREAWARAGGDRAMRLNKEELKAKIGSAKAAGRAVNEARQRIVRTKAAIEALREGGEDAEGNENEKERVEKEEELRAAMERDKRAYKEQFARLRQLKTEIEQVQRLMERNRRKIVRDFETWLQAVQRTQHIHAATGAVGHTADNGSSTPVARTGNARTDADIAAFYEAKRELEARLRTAP